MAEQRDALGPWLGEGCLGASICITVPWLWASAVSTVCQHAAACQQLGGMVPWQRRACSRGWKKVETGMMCEPEVTWVWEVPQLSRRWSQLLPGITVRGTECFGTRALGGSSQPSGFSVFPLSSCSHFRKLRPGNEARGE